MSEPTKEELLAFIRKHGPEKVDSITDTESAIRHFRCTSKVYKEQRDQYKAERDTLNSKLNQSYEDNYKLEGQLHDMTKQRDTLIDDIAVLKANISRLERENRNLKNENKAILSQSNSYFDEWQNEQTTSRGLREQCKEYAQDASKYLHLTEHIRSKAENNPGVSRYIDLVNYIDKLEGEKNDV